MKLVALCLFAVCALVNTTTTIEEKKLKEVLKQLYDVRNSLQNTEKMLNTPPQNIEDCCCLSALQCFRANLQVHFDITEKKQSRFYKSLKSPITERGMDLCNSGNKTTCQDCDSHPKVNAAEFFNRLESLIQRGITKLSMN